MQDPDETIWFGISCIIYCAFPGNLLPPQHLASFLMNKNKLKAILKNFSGQKILVIGDMVADEYIFGMTSRISREAPVIILKYTSQAVLPGCGANAVNNINTLGGDVLMT